MTNIIKSQKNKVNLNGSLCYITFKKLEKYPELRHLFSTRLGGVSKGYFGQLNLSFKVGDERADVLQNYKILCEELGTDVQNIVLSQQTHTDNVLIVGKKDCGKGILRESDFSDIDALITNEKGVALVTHSADCCLLGFYDPIKKVIASAHAGWRGTVAEIGLKTVNKMVESFGCKSENIIAVLAPSIGKCCYEVDAPVYNEFARLEYLKLDLIFENKQNGKYMLDLWQANKQILCHAGIKEENIELTDICTNCQSEFLHSHRATGGKRGVNGLIMELR